MLKRKEDTNFENKDCIISQIETENVTTKIPDNKLRFSKDFNKSDNLNKKISPFLSNIQSDNNSEIDIKSLIPKK